MHVTDEDSAKRNVPNIFFLSNYCLVSKSLLFRDTSLVHPEGSHWVPSSGTPTGATCVARDEDILP